MWHRRAWGCLVWAMGKWHYFDAYGRLLGWVYNESCGACGAPLRRRDWYSAGAWADVTTIAGSPWNGYYDGFLRTNAAGVVEVCRCVSCGGTARTSWRTQGPGLIQEPLVQR